MSPRTTSDAGGWAGVAYLSTVPCRTMATPWPPDLYESGRISLPPSVRHCLGFQGRLFMDFLKVRLTLERLS